MNARVTIAAALAAGFVGGAASRHFEPKPVLAQGEESSQVIKPQKFVLVDRTGASLGVFGIEENGTPQIEVIGYHGHVYATRFRRWAMVHGLMAESGSLGPKKPTLLPANH
jgi:hypothetical protein